MFAAQKVSSAKQTLRKIMLARREQLSVEERAGKSAAITGRLCMMPQYRGAGTVLGYMNFGSEYASEPWVQQVLADGKKLVLPRVNRHANRLDLYWVDDLEEQIAAGSWGIREPIVERCRRLGNLDEVEFALLPGVAFSRDGARLGYGGGYYDKLLAHLESPPVLVAAAFSMQVVDGIPVEAGDRNVEWLVTEHETYNVPRAGMHV